MTWYKYGRRFCNQPELLGLVGLSAQRVLRVLHFSVILCWMCSKCCALPRLCFALVGSHHMVLLEGAPATECAKRKPHADTLLLCSKELTRCRPDIQEAFRHLGADAAVSVYAALQQSNSQAA